MLLYRDTLDCVTISLKSRSMKKTNVAIIGTGASGLLCAIFCAKGGAHVDIYEQNAKPVTHVAERCQKRLSLHTDLLATISSYVITVNII